jgi:hypothetical protein
MNPESLKGFAVSAVVSAAVSFGMLHAIVAPQAHARTAESQLLAAAPRGDAPDAAVAARPAPREQSGDSSAMREAYSDGGYWDWMEQQHAMP